MNAALKVAHSSNDLMLLLEDYFLRLEPSFSNISGDSGHYA